MPGPTRSVRFSFPYSRVWRCELCGFDGPAGPALYDDEVARVMDGRPFKLYFGPATDPVALAECDVLMVKGEMER